jgi:hypothetical protein
VFSEQKTGNRHYLATRSGANASNHQRHREKRYNRELTLSVTKNWDFRRAGEIDCDEQPGRDYCSLDRPNSHNTTSNGDIDQAMDTDQSNRQQE